MDPLSVLDNTDHIPAFDERLRRDERFPLQATGLDVFQINVGRRCNLSCKHCHVQAGPTRGEVMTRETFDTCREIIARHAEIGTVDITGGAPEMNPAVAPFIEAIAPLGRRLIVRTNGAILLEEEHRHHVDLYARSGVEVVCSLPDHSAAQSDRVRGQGSFARIIAALRLLNEHGYGEPGSDLQLQLVHNPVGAYLPGPQQALEQEYRRRLRDDHGVSFSGLYTITNMPVGSYLDFLLATDNYDSYMDTLFDAYNPTAVDSVMCKGTVSVGWDGSLHDCDFNQMLGIPLSDGAPQHVSEFSLAALVQRRVATHRHCYGCTAGSGSSCQGATTG